MSIGAVYCVYNEEEYLAYSIRSVYDWVDRVYVLLADAPYTAYNPNARTQFAAVDETERIVRELAASHPCLTLVKGRWTSELAHRNAGVTLCRRDGLRHYFLVDGDEVYRRDHLDAVRQEMAAHPEAGQFIIKCHTFWRSFRYRITAEELTWMPRRIFRLSAWSRLGKSAVPVPWPARFTGNNKTNSWGSVYHIPPDRAVFYHFSYARRPAKMYEKLRTFSHAHEIPEDWYERVWLAWARDRAMTNLNPVDPPKFPRVVKQDPADLPEVLRDHPYAAMDVIE